MSQWATYLTLDLVIESIKGHQTDSNHQTFSTNEHIQQKHDMSQAAHRRWLHNIASEHNLICC